ncbi:hypothetical protein FCH28_33620 [Streptomyces piniterrae]|uniref:Uncharacterized protein n=1 Tax=Streptomyces piniterrae TaxID=2571125 RepID=A0A4U0MPR7_9ACTN|nr:hypothetical protein [Streptomyces piniterrae]TJZ42831.1 hypothetical protein FCH28_33620 [Streptomyces piniterrae]
MANQYPGPPPEEPDQNPYAQPPGGQPVEAGYGYPQGGKPGDPGYGYPQAGQPADPGYGYPQAAPGTPPSTPPPPPAAPPAQPAPAGGGMQLMSIGDISVTGDTIVTPGGPMPLKGAAWTATDMSRTEVTTPPYAVVLAIVFFFACLLGLLFLLMKERKTTGFVQVTVNSGGRHHATMIPVQSPDQVMFVLNQVNYARSLSV